ELGSYFYSPIFYVVTTVFLVLYSFMFFSVLSQFSKMSFQAAQFKQMGYSINPNELVIEPSLANMGVILLFIIPVITMRSFADERKSKTFSLLLSSPVSLWEIVWGKFLACLGVVAFMILLSSYSIVFIIVMGEPEMGPIFSGYLGLLLMTGCYIAMGVFASSLTDNQIVAAVIAFGLSLLMWVLAFPAQAADSGVGIILEYLSLLSHLETFLKGVIDSSDIAYYFSFILFNLFLTYRVLDSRRWR
ncbi:MAG: ABC transporter permease subunit, partial [Nitrospinaceae bacterium]|nr:ABC transporter permease subunit [Nitrospinaceae bacterium]NIR53346.1 ABC transporter permease subunit [Nitrospinaceae bacterium]NIS83746.1 ABC transporter permease subunit [Nitrospinaceae bacterium]NIT80545.1 ABC transporter permease subunit [Nitrospinaceae bacterium]NIU42870.1 ABC transporter permease subunit [Nitrospinaceae bacterium]